MMQSLDLFIAMQLNMIGSSSKVFVSITTFFAEYLPYILIVIVVFLGLQSRKWFWTAGLSIIAAGVTRLIIKPLFVTVYARPRPFVEDEAIHTLVKTFSFENTQSFPSGHEIFFSAIATVMYVHDKRWGIFFFVCAVLMGIARVAAGVHYPSDILGGLVLGVFTGIVVVFLGKRMLIRV